MAERDVIGVTCSGIELAIYRVEGVHYASQDLCTHMAARLSEGEVVECYIECPLHFGLFDIRTGKAQGAPVTQDIKTYPVKIADGRILVGLGPEPS